MLTNDAAAARSDYWSHEGELGTAARWGFEGEDGLGRLSGPSTVTADQPGRFRARLTRLQLDHVALEAFQAGPHRTERTRRDVAEDPTELMTVLVLVKGGLVVATPDSAIDLRAGEAVVIDSRGPLSVTASVDVRLLRSVVGIEHVPMELRQPVITVLGPLPRTPLTDSFVGFASSILRSAADGRSARGEHLIRAVAELQSAVLAEARVPARASDGPAGLRARMADYIEAHFMEPEIDPGAVADAVGISLRHAHSVFGDGERTIARSIQERRVTAIALELRTRDEPVQFAHLARRYGFGSADTLGRAFRQRFGMTLTDYRTGGHRSFE